MGMGKAEKMDIKKLIDGKSVLITGGTGTFGQAFVKVCLERYTPKRLIVFSRDELKQYEMALKYPESQYIVRDIS